MTSRKLAIITALALALSGGAAFAQIDQAETGFYADPVLPDPPLVALHVYPASEATADVAAVAPSRRKLAATGCTSRNPCAVVTPARS